MSKDEESREEDSLPGEHVVENNALAKKVQMGGMLLFWSAILLVEGCGRFIRVAGTPSDAWGGDSKTFPPVVLLIGAVFEVCFAMFGLAVGAGACIFNYHNVGLTIAALISQLVGGWFVFVVSVLAQPAFNIDNGNGPPRHPFLAFSEAEKDAAAVFGFILTSISFCGVVQGMQFFLTFQLYKIQKGTPEDPNNKTPTANRLRYYAFMQFLGGIGCLVCGALVLDKQGGGFQSSGPWIYPPNFIMYPEMTLVSGILILLMSIAGIVSSFSMAAVNIYYMISLLTWMYLISCHVMAQIGLAGAQWAFAGEMICGLSTSLCLAGCYFAYKLKNE